MRPTKHECFPVTRVSEHHLCLGTELQKEEKLYRDVSKVNRGEGKHANK